MLNHSLFLISVCFSKSEKFCDNYNNKISIWCFIKYFFESPTKENFFKVFRRGSTVTYKIILIGFILALNTYNYYLVKGQFINFDIYTHISGSAVMDSPEVSYTN